MTSTTSSAVTNHSELPPWKIELIQRKKKFGALSPTQRNIMQCDISNTADAHSGKCFFLSTPSAIIMLPFVIIITGINCRRNDVNLP